MQFLLWSEDCPNLSENNWNIGGYGTGFEWDWIYARANNERDSSTVSKGVKQQPKYSKKPRAKGGSQKFILSLFVAGMTPKSLRAIENARQLCDQYLEGRYDLEVIDVYQQPGLAKDAQVIAAPTLLSICRPRSKDLSVIFPTLNLFW